MPKPKPHCLHKLSPVALAWIAGLLEGEGYFSIPGKKTRDQTFNIGCGMTDKDVIYKLKSITGVGRLSCFVPKRGKPVHYWKVCNANACELSSKLLPLMGKRRQKRIRECLIWYARKIARLPIYRIRRLSTGRVETPHVLKDWCRKHHIKKHELYDTMARTRAHINGFVREA